MWDNCFSQVVQITNTNELMCYWTAKQLVETALTL